jgi:hypothetical protein
MNRALFLVFFMFHYLGGNLHSIEPLTLLWLSELPASVLSELSSKQLPDALKKYQHQQVSIRGFVYQTADGSLLLAAEPNLKNCCVASQGMITRQVMLIGNHIPFSTNGRAKTIQGRFEIEPAKDENGNWKTLFILYEPKIIENNREAHHGLLYFSGGLGLILIGIFLVRSCIWSRARREKNSSCSDRKILL